MKILYFDCFSGISGDMTVGALLDLGIEKEDFLRELQKLNLDGFTTEINKTVKNGILGTDFNVLLVEEHTNSRQNEHEHTHSHRRNLHDITHLIEHSELSSNIKKMALAVFNEIGQAETKVHGKDISEIHFHEVGAIDSIVDIVGAAICFNLLGVERILSSHPSEGHGFVKCEHGLIPVPVPAVIKMLEGSDIQLQIRDIPTELITPTGLGILKTVASEFTCVPQMKIIKTGYGFGKKDTGSLNALRVFLGETDDLECTDEVILIEANIDNDTAEELGFAMEEIFKAGALDTWFTSIQMKKNRPAIMLSILCDKVKLSEITNQILKNTSTIGVRTSIVTRYKKERWFETVQTPYGDIKVKLSSWNGMVKCSPEFEDCKRIATERSIPLRVILQAAVTAWEQK